MSKEEVNELIVDSIEEFKGKVSFRDDLTISELHNLRNNIFHTTISYWIQETSPDKGYDYEALGNLVYKLSEGLTDVIINDFIDL